MTAPTMHPPLAHLPETRRAILQYLKRRGIATTETLAETVGITVSGMRQHLTALERDDLVAHDAQREGPGRPRFRYRLTPTAELLFPRNYVDLTNELLAYVEDEDPEMLERIFDKRGQRRLADARRRLAGLPFAEQVQTLATILDEDGYLADCVQEDDGTFRITEHNCAVLGVAFRYGHACRTELDFLRAALPNADIVRVAHMVAGNHVCAYTITPRVDE